MKREESEYAIKCDPYCGPIFGDDIFIFGTILNGCSIDNDGEGAYECHPEYKSSLFVNTAGPNEKNYFFVIDYEVYTH